MTRNSVSFLKVIRYIKCFFGLNYIFTFLISSPFHYDIVSGKWGHMSQLLFSNIELQVNSVLLQVEKPFIEIFSR